MSIAARRVAFEGYKRECAPSDPEDRASWTSRKGRRNLCEDDNTGVVPVVWNEGGPHILRHGAKQGNLSSRPLTLAEQVIVEETTRAIVPPVGVVPPVRPRLGLCHAPGRRVRR